MADLEGFFFFGGGGGGGGASEPPFGTKLFHFHGEFYEKLSKIVKTNPPW